MNEVLVKALFISLALTIALECGFFLMTGKRNKSDFLLVVMVNVMTNPAAVLLYWLAALYTVWNNIIICIFLELFAILAEGYCYLRRGREIGRPFAFSLAANIFSFGIAFIFQCIFKGVI